MKAVPDDESLPVSIHHLLYRLNLPVLVADPLPASAAESQRHAVPDAESLPVFIQHSL